MNVTDLDDRSARGRPRWPAVLWVAAVMSLAGAGASPGRVPDAHRAAVDPERLGRVLKEHVLRTLDGRTLSLGTLRGEVVVVNFWASWCSPCRQELPRLDALHASIAGRGGRVVAVSIDQETRNVRRFVRTHRLSLPIYHDGPDGLARTLDLPHVPFTVLLDRAGAVALASAGADDRAFDAIARRTRSLIAAGPDPARTLAGETP